MRPAPAGPWTAIATRTPKMTFPPASMLSDGFFLSLSLCLDIGLVNVAMLSLTLSHGFRPGFWLGLGSCVGDLVYAALALGGMAVLTATRRCARVIP